MRPDVLKALARQGAPQSSDGTVRLYHATSRTAKTDILSTGQLLPIEPDDPALRTRGGGSIWLASRPSILDDLHTAEVVLAVSLRPQDAPEAEILRDDLGDPPRTEIELMQRTSPLRLTYAADLHEPPPTPSPSVDAAIKDFAASPVGQQLADPDECRGRCKRASQRFVAALRVHGENGRIIEWAWHGAWHNAVLVADDLVVDWTASQFDPAVAPGPELTSRAQKDLQMLTAYSAPAGMCIDPDDRFLQRHVDAWEYARERIPVSEIDAAAFAASEPPGSC